MTTAAAPHWTAKKDCRSYLNAGVITDGPMIYGIYTDEARIAVMSEGTGLDDDSQARNARLIAAAPELLDALETLVAITQFGPDGNHPATVRAEALLRRIAGEAPNEAAR